MVLYQLRAAVGKSVLQKSYKPCSFCVEMCLPIIFILGAVALWSLSSDTTFPANNFFTTNETDNDVVVRGAYRNLTTAICINVTTDAELNAHPAGKVLKRCDSFATNLPIFPMVKNDPSNAPDPVEFDNLAIRGVTNAKDATLGVLGFLNVFSTKTVEPQYIPTLDDVLLVQYIATRYVPFSVRQNDFNNPVATVARSGRIYFAGASSSGITNLINYLNTSSSLFNTFYGRTFSSVVEGLTFSEQIENADNFLALLVVNKWDATDFEVELRFNRTSIPFTSQIRRQFEVDGIGRNPIRFFTSSGFLTIQQMAYEAYASTVHSINLANQDHPDSNRSVVITPMPYPSYINNDFLNLAGSIAPLLIVLGYLYPVSQLCRSIVEEKELRVREAMMIMGLSTGAFYASWIIIYMLMHLIISLVIAGICKGTMLAKADFGIVFFLFLFFGWSTLMLSLLLSSFFSKARAAALIAPVFFFVLSIPAFALSQDAPASTLAGLGILSPTAFSLGLRLLFNYENVQGLKGADFASTTDDVNMATVFALLIIDIFLYLLLGLYFDAVLPSEWGTSSHPLLCLEEPFKKLCCFCCMKSDEEKEKEALEEEHITKNEDGIPDARLAGGFFEDQTDAAKEREKENPSAVKLLGLRKEYQIADGSTLRAVKDMTVNIANDSIFCLLGHNAAGKTTTMNMLTGMIPITTGDATIFGHSVRHEMHEVRNMTGYCPQHNILWPELTCMEHLRFYAALKGKTGDDAEEACKRMMNDVGLWEKRHSAAGTLSGGQKRKLSVGIAFIGESKFVLLDEPTAGMDVGARRKLWDLIRALGKGRVILLSTHFMDEADLLGDEIAIMSHGRLFCLGSRTFLKSNLGVGYTLTLALRGDDVKQHDRHALVKLVQQHIDCAHLEDSPPGELIIKLPTQDTSNFPEMLRAVERDSEKHGATGFGINATTLEEVFVKIDDRHAQEEAKEKQQKEEQQKNNNSSGTSAVEVEGKSPATQQQKDDDDNDSQEEEYTKLFDPSERARIDVTFFDQVSVLMMKRYKYATRDTRTVVLQLVVPIVALLFAMALASVTFPDQPSVTLGPELYDGSRTVVAECFDASMTPEKFATYALPRASINTPMQFGYANTTQALQAYLLASHKGHEGDRPSAFACNSSALRIPGPVLFSNESVPHAPGVVTAEYYAMRIKSQLDSTAINMKTVLNPLPFSLYQQAQIGQFSALLIGIFVMVPFAIIPSSFVSFIVKEREYHSKDLQLIMGLQFLPYWFTNLVFDFVCFFITNILAIIVFLIFDREEYIGSGTNFGAIFLLFTLYSLSGTAFAYFCSFFFDSHTVAQNTVMLINFVCGFLLVILNFVLSFLEDTKAASDVLKWIFRITPAFALGEGIVAVAVADQTRTFDKSLGNSMTLDIAGYNLIFLSFMFPIYFGLTLWFDHPASNARNLIRKFTKYCCCLCNLCSDDLEEAPEEEEEAQSPAPKKTNPDQNNKRDSPNPLNQSSNDETEFEQRKYSEQNKNDSNNNDQEMQRTGSMTSGKQNSTTAFVPKEDEDVVAERKRVAKIHVGSEADKNEVVVVKNLRKVWPATPKDVVAVDDISFSVPVGGRFFLLGVNGSGKSSTISTLCGQTAPTSGRGFIGGYDVETETQDVRRIIGYCPQHDALTELLTVEEHFKLYCGLRGVPPEKIEGVMNKLIDLGDLEEHRFKTAESLSGGNKRKLSFALALIGGPDVVFLDEVSAGIDPLARHKLWTLVERVSRECSMVLTTHHLEEVEALATRCAIQVAGKFKCIGTLQHLKNKFGSGFEVQLRVKHDSDVPACQDALGEKFPELEWSEIRGSKMAATLPQNTKLSEVFEFLGKKSEELAIEDYTVHQSSIEQVFLRIAAAALEKQGDF